MHRGEGNTAAHRCVLCSLLSSASGRPAPRRVLGSGNAGRFPPRRRRKPLDRRTRPADARARAAARARCRCAVRLDDAAGPDESVFLGTGNDGKVAARRPQRHRHACSSTAARWKCTRLRPRRTAGCMSAPHPTAASTASTRKGQATPFFDPDDKYIWALAVDAKGTVYAATGDKGVVYRITPDGKGDAVFHEQDDACDVAGVRCHRAAARRHRIARPRVPRRRAGQGLPAARYAVSGNASALRFDAKGIAVRRRAERHGRRRAATTGAFPHADRRAAAAAPSRASRPRSPRSRSSTCR